ncbi:hypothetical protein Tco_1262389, partial [Tanacetum coccineum]
TLEPNLKPTKLTYGAAYTKLIMKVKKLEHKVKSSKARRRVKLVVSEDEDELEDPAKLLGKKLNLFRRRQKERQRIARVHEEASTFNAKEWDNIQTQIEADKELAPRLQAQEREIL